MNQEHPPDVYQNKNESASYRLRVTGASQLATGNWQLVTRNTQPT